MPLRSMRSPSYETLATFTNVVALLALFCTVVYAEMVSPAPSSTMNSMGSSVSDPRNSMESMVMEDLVMAPPPGLTNCRM